MKSLQYLASSNHVKVNHVLEAIEEFATKGVSFDVNLTKRVIDKAPLEWRHLTTLRGYFTQGLNKRMDSPLECQPETQDYHLLLNYIRQKIDERFIG
ncbi:MAG: hypothetical protein Q8Q31_01055 [Nanoarchaeota archaeon]|nr:hypothetical protein [Nanoarchaeota archaeon]